ncbi:MAG TPA: hypothetical protein VMW16_07875 [Sedimentisphaerales bacterium]|nr:hypothetical protein [Sedimentisphaerales bacterium]
MKGGGSFKKRILLVLEFGLILATNAAEAARGSEELEFSLPDIFGRRVHSQDYKGVPVFLEFGACW